MSNYLQTLTADLDRMEELMRMLLTTPSDFEHLLSLYLLYIKHQHTNDIIDYANNVLKSGEGLDQLLSDAKALNKGVAKCHILYTDNKEAFDSIDNNSLLKAHIKPFSYAEKAEADIAASLWKQFSQLSNQLDFMDCQSDEFRKKDAECDAVKAKYDIHHSKVSELHVNWSKEVKRCSIALGFRLEDLSLVFYYMQGISQSIIDTITKQRGG